MVVISAPLGSGGRDELTDALMCALALRSQPRARLHALYQGWIDTVQALERRSRDRGVRDARFSGGSGSAYRGDRRVPEPRHADRETARRSSP